MLLEISELSSVVVSEESPNGGDLGAPELEAEPWDRAEPLAIFDYNPEWQNAFGLGDEIILNEKHLMRLCM